jgi:hypothetical protein
MPPYYGQVPQVFRSVPYFRPQLIAEESEYVVDAFDGNPSGPDWPPKKYEPSLNPDGTVAVDENGNIIYEEKEQDSFFNNNIGNPNIGIAYYPFIGTINGGMIPTWKWPVGGFSFYEELLEGEGTEYERVVTAINYSWTWDENYRTGGILRKEEYPFLWYETLPPNSENNHTPYPLNTSVIYCQGRPTDTPETEGWANAFRFLAQSYPIHNATAGDDSWSFDAPVWGDRAPSLQGQSESTWFLKPVLDENGDEVPNPRYVGEENRFNISADLSAYIGSSSGPQTNGGSGETRGWEIHYKHWHKYKVVYHPTDAQVNNWGVTNTSVETTQEVVNNLPDSYYFVEKNSTTFESRINGAGPWKKSNGLQIGQEYYFRTYKFNQSQSGGEDGGVLSVNYEWDISSRFESGYYAFDKGMHPTPPDNAGPIAVGGSLDWVFKELNAAGLASTYSECGGYTPYTTEVGRPSFQSF